MLHLSIILSWLAYLINMSYYISFAESGMANKIPVSLAGFVFGVSDLLIVYLLIFLAKGWTLVRYKISSSGRLKVS